MKSYFIEFLPMDLKFTLKLEQECPREHIESFVEYLIAEKPDKQNAIKKAPFFFDCKIMDMENYLPAELDGDLVFIEER